MASKVNSYGHMEIARKYKSPKTGKETIGAKKKIVASRNPSEYNKFVSKQWADPNFKDKYMNDDGKPYFKGASKEISRLWASSGLKKAPKAKTAKKKTVKKKNNQKISHLYASYKCPV